MIKRSLSALLTLVLPAMMAAPAAAADVPIHPPVYKGPPMNIYPSWAGFYVGVNAGYGFGSGDATFVPGGSFDPAISLGTIPPSAALEAKGFVGGVQAGYNYQFGRSLVAGLEADLDYSTIKASTTVSTTGLQTVTTTFDHKMDWFGTARVRAGYLMTDSLLLYGTGGLAFGHVKDSANVATSISGEVYTGAADKLQMGWTLGAGLEWAMSRTWSVKAEYLYYALGKNTVNMAAVAGPFPAATDAVTFENTGQIGRVGLNYRF